MKLVTFTHQGRTRIGEWVGDIIYTVDFPDNMTQMIRRRITTGRTFEHFALDKVKLEAPLRPHKIVAVGKNYADHARETGGEPPTEPILFAKYVTSLIGTGETITWRESVTRQVDWEGELAVIIRRRAKDVQEADAYDYVHGYTIANDVSARDLQTGDANPGGQWVRSKSLDTFGPLGPCIVTKDDIADPHALRIQTYVNDELVQDGSTGEMIFKIPTLIAYITKYFTLEAGDVILTGTPAGVGHGMQPPRYLASGDRVRVVIDGIGELINECRIDS